MHTHCTICGLAIEADAPWEASAICAECFMLNFSGQTFPEVDVPRVRCGGLARRRAAYERIVLRHREERGDAG